MMRMLVFGLSVLLGGMGVFAANRDAFTVTPLFTATGYSAAQRFSQPGGLFYDSARGELYVADSGNHQLVVFDRKGMAISRIPHLIMDPVKNERIPGEPKNVIVRKNGDLLITDNQCAYIDVLDFQGHPLQTIWPADWFDLPRNKVLPRCLAQDAAGNIYVGISGCISAIVVLTPDLKYERAINANLDGGDTDNGKAITGLWVDANNRIYASYAQGECVRIFSTSGKQQAVFGEHDAGPDNFSLPTGLATDGRGNIWISDGLRHLVTIFKPTPDGKPTYFSSIGGFGANPGNFQFPSAITGDGQSLIFVLEGTGARVQAFKVAYTDGGN